MTNKLPGISDLLKNYTFQQRKAMVYSMYINNMIGTPGIETIFEFNGENYICNRNIIIDLQVHNTKHTLTCFIHLDGKIVCLYNDCPAFGQDYIDLKLFKHFSHFQKEIHDNHQ